MRATEFILTEVIMYPPTSTAGTGVAEWAYSDCLAKKAKELSPLNVGLKNQVFEFPDHIKIIVFDEDNTHIQYLALAPFNDGFKVSTVATEPAASGKGIAVKIYAAASSYFNKPIYSDSTQTDASRLGIWKKLWSQYPERLVGYDQKTKQDLQLGYGKDNMPIANQTQPIYSPTNGKDVTSRSRTRLLKLLPTVG